MLVVANFSGQLATLIGLGVGIDYALFIVSRHRAELRSGSPVEEAIQTATRTTGHAVLVAGTTVCIALLGLLVLGQSILYGRAEPDERSAKRWERWAAGVRRRPALAASAGVLVMVVLAVPFFSLRLGVADEGAGSPSLTSRRAYDLMAEGFGKGFNAPFLLAAELHGPGDRPRLDALAARLWHERDVAHVTTPVLSPGGGAAVLRLYPASSPQARATSDLLDHLRGATQRQSGLNVHVGGAAAATADLASLMNAKLPLFALAVIGLSFMLLMGTFRSIAIPALGAIMNVLAAGAAFGIVIAVFQWGWGRSLIGLDSTAPIDPFIPMFVMAILFGLSTDYQVCLVSRIREHWLQTHDNRLAVARGQADSAHVIIAAATIMVFVFASFVFAPQGGSSSSG